jgi:hypothetical protein
LAAQNAETTRRIVERREIDLVLLCRSPAERAFYRADGRSETLYHRLDRGDPPSWLAAVELPASLQANARLYQVLR